MNKALKLTLAMVFIAVSAMAQDKYFTKNGSIFFECTKSPLEKIEGTNNSVVCVLDTKTGNLQFSVQMKGFEFKRALMQEHFNENYVESHKFPKSEFKGQITNNSAINYTKDGEYTANVKGKLTVHGETKDVETTGKITVKGGKIVSSSTFTILLSDYKIEIPSVVSDKISNTVNIKVDCSLEPLKS